jgi:peptidyl-prolyl cis-trans isomerase D
MLKLFRQRKLAVRVMLFAIVGLVGFMMVVTLVPGLSSVDISLGDPQGALARVDDVAITSEDARREFQRQARQLGGSTPQLRPFLMQQVVDGLITRNTLIYEANRLGLKAPPEEIQARLRQISLLYPGGQFVGAEAYRALIQSQMGITVQEFEQGIRRQLLIDKLAMWVTGGVSVSPDEIEQEFRRQNDRAQIEYVEFPPARYATQVQPSEDDLKAYYQANLTRYQQPERRSVRFVPVDFEELRQRLSVSPQEIEDFYRRNLDDYRLPDRVRVRHILFLRDLASSIVPGGAGETGEEPGEGASDPLREEAQQVLEQLRGGAAFAALAGEHSDDQATRESGGEIGWVQRGQTVPALEQVLFSVPSGSEPQLVETSYGFHIAQVMERQDARVRPLEEVRPGIEPALKDQMVQREALAQARRIVDAVRAGKTLDEAAQEEGWPVLESPPFAPTDSLPGLGSERDFQNEAFRLPAATAGQPDAPVSDAITVQAGYTLLQLKEVIAAHEASFEEVRRQVEGSYRSEQGAERARQAAEKLASDVAAGAAWRSAIRQPVLQLATPDPFSRGSLVQGLGSASDLALAFSLPVGEVSPAVSIGGKWVVFRVVDRQEVESSLIPPDQLDSMRDQLLQQKRQLTWTVFTQSLRKRLQDEGKLELNDAAIERLTSQA